MHEQRQFLPHLFIEKAVDLCFQNPIIKVYTVTVTKLVL